MRLIIGICFVAFVIVVWGGCSDDDTFIGSTTVVDTVYVAMPPHMLLKTLACYQEWFEDYPLHPGRDCKEPPECIVATKIADTIPIGTLRPDSD